VDTRYDVLARVVGIAANTKKIEDQLKLTKHDLNTRVSKRTEVDGGILKHLLRTVTNLTVNFSFFRTVEYCPAVCIRGFRVQILILLPAKQTEIFYRMFSNLGWTISPSTRNRAKPLLPHPYQYTVHTYHLIFLCIIKCLQVSQQ
jgi:hypothetical protein